MKQLILFAVAVTFFLTALRAQSPLYGTIDINQVRTAVQSNGGLFWHDYWQFAQYFVPADSSASTIFAGGVWLGGLDAGNTLHLAAQTYRQTGDDFFQGPVQDSQWYTMQSNAVWNRVWKINKTSIDSLILWQTNPAMYPNYTMPFDILTWPGNGDVTRGQAAQLAPYVDANGDGVYDPQNGDYPCIKGDQCLFFIYNDDRAAHTESGGAKMKVEVHGMMYAYSAPGTWLDSALFINYKLYNRSGNTYHDVYWGQWTDFDIGDAFDDYVGCDVTRNIGYGYNGDFHDGPSALPSAGTYGANPPAQGVVFLRGPEADSGDGINNDRDMFVDEPGEMCMMTHFMYYENDFSVRGNPEYADDFYGYLKGEWKDSSVATYGGNAYGGATPSDFMFPGNSDPTGWGTNGVQQLPWDELSSGNLPYDRRAIASTGPFTLNPGESNCIDFAYVFARGNNGPASGVAAMQNASDSAHSFYALNNPCSCDDRTVGIGSHPSSVVGIYPNPATDNINVLCGDNSTGALIEVLDLYGNIVLCSKVVSGNSVVLSTNELSAGLYLVRVTNHGVTSTGRFVKQ